jgi:hypothetical protein
MALHTIGRRIQGSAPPKGTEEPNQASEGAEASYWAVEGTEVSRLEEGNQAGWVIPWDIVSDTDLEASQSIAFK